MRIHGIVVDKVACRIENDLAVVEFDALRRMVGMPPVEIGAEIEQIVDQSLPGRRAFFRRCSDRDETGRAQAR